MNLKIITVAGLVAFLLVNVAIVIEHRSIESEANAITLDATNAQIEYLRCIYNGVKTLDDCKKDIDTNLSILQERLNNVKIKMNIADNRIYNYWSWF